MDRLFVIIDLGHGLNTTGKWSPKFKTVAEVGDMTFLPNERFLEYYFNSAVAGLLSYNLRKSSIPNAILNNTTSDINSTERGKLHKVLYDRAIKLGLTPVTISVHANALGDGEQWNKAQGVETFYKEGCEESKKLATYVQSEVMQYRKLYKPLNQNTDRGVKTANFFHFRNFKGTVVLFEGEFMSNLETLKILCTTLYQQQCASAICKAIIKLQGGTMVGNLNPKENKRI